MITYDASDDRTKDTEYARQWGGADPSRHCATCDKILLNDETCEFHFRIMCGWCKPPKAMGYPPCAEAMDGQISHGICKPCSEKFIKEMGEQK